MKGDYRNRAWISSETARISLFFDGQAKALPHHFQSSLNDTPPPSTGNVCLGVWTQKGNVYQLKHPSWTFDGNGNLNGTAVIRESVTVDPHGNTFSGTFRVDVYDLSNNLLYHLDGTLSAQRITAD